MILLTEEEIAEVRCWPDEVIGDHKPDSYDYIEAGAKAQLKKVVELIELKDDGLSEQGYPSMTMVFDDVVLQALLKEAG